MPKYESQSDVIRAIKRASDAELRALADISRQLKETGGAGGLRYVKASNAGKYRQPRSNEIGRAIESAMSAHTGSNSGTNSARRSPYGGTIPAQVSASTVRKSRQMIQKAVNDTIESAAGAIIESIESDISAQIGTKAARRKPVRNPSAGAAPSGHYYDDNGRLRTNNGRYASKEANERAKNSRSTDKEAAETNGLIKKLLTGMGRGAANGLSGEGNGDIGAGAAGMGVMWQASKELAGVVKGAGQNTIDMAKFLNDTRNSVKGKSILRGFSANDARASVKESKEIAAAEAAKAQHKDNVDTHANQEREISLLQEIAHKVGGGGGDSGGGLLSGIGKVIGGGFGLGMLKRGYSAIRSRLPGGRGKGIGAGELDDAGNLKKAGKTAGKGAGKAAVEAGEKGAEKLGKGSLVKAGENLLGKGGLKAAGKIGLRAIPIIGTLASAGIDAYQGWNDDDNLKSTFGANAGNKERFAQATANVADLGGLVSGTSNLISGVLNDLGFSSASAAFQMNGSTGLAKKIDSLIGGSEDEADKRNDSLLDKLSEIVTGVKALTPQAAQNLSNVAQTALTDNAALTGSKMQMATKTVMDANGELNKSRLKRGLSVNPIAQTQLSGSSKGINNNNIGNLRFANQAGAVAEANWKPRYAGDSPMAAFATPEEGIRAAGNNLMRYNKKGVKTLDAIINKWAPKSDHNDTQAYVNSVAKTIGVSPNAEIDASDPAITAKLIAAVGQHENGSFNMSADDVQKSLGTVQGGKYVGGWTDATQAALSKTDAGKAILANNTGGAAAAISAVGAKATATAIPVNPAPAAGASKGWGDTVMGWVKSGANSINNGANTLVPGLKYSNANAGMGLGGVTRSKLAPMLNGDAMVNTSSKIALPTPATLSQGGGLLSGVFNQATQAISGQGIMSGLTNNMAPGWQYALNPLTNAAGNGIDSVLNLGRQTVGGWLNGSSSTQRSVTNLSASGARLSPDSSVTKSQDAQQSTLEEIASYLEEMLGIQKKPAGGADKTKDGAQPGPSGDIPLASSSSVINTILKRNR